MEEQNVKRNLMAEFLLYLLLLCILAMISYMAVMRIINNFSLLKDAVLGNVMEASDYLTVINTACDILSIWFSLGLLLPGTKKNILKRYRMRIAYFMSLLVSYSMSLLLAEGKLLLPYLKAKDYSYFLSNIPLLAILLVLLAITAAAKLTINYKMVAVKKLKFFLILISAILLVYGIYSLIMTKEFQLNAILNTGIAILTTLYAVLLSRILPKQMTEEITFKVVNIEDQKVRLYSSVSHHVAKSKAPAVLSVIASFISIPFMGIIAFVKWVSSEKMLNVGPFVIGEIVSFVFLILFINTLKKNNAKGMPLPNLYTLALGVTAALLNEAMGDYFDTTGSAMTVLILVSIFVLVLHKSCMSRHAILPFEKCTVPLIVSDFLLLFLVFAVGFRNSESSYVWILVFVYVFNIFYLLSVRKNGCLEYVKAKPEDEVTETIR